MSQPDWLPHEGHPNLTGRPDFFSSRVTTISASFFSGEENVGVFELRHHSVEVSDEVGRKVAAVLVATAILMGITHIEPACPSLPQRGERCLGAHFKCSKSSRGGAAAAPTRLCPG